MSNSCKDIFIPVETNVVTGMKKNMFLSLIRNSISYLSMMNN